MERQISKHHLENHLKFVEEFQLPKKEQIEGLKIKSGTPLNWL